MKAKADTSFTEYQTPSPLLRLSLVVLVFSFFNLGYMESTLKIQYIVIPVSCLAYAMASRKTLLDSATSYVMSNHMRIRWLFNIWMILSLLWSINPAGADARVLSTMILYTTCFVIYDAVRVWNLTRYILHTIFYSASLCAVLTIAFLPFTAVTARPTIIYGNPNTIALICLTGLATYFIRTSPGSNLWLRWSRHLLGASLILATIASSSRKGLMGICFLLIAALFHRVGRAKVLSLTALVIPFLIIVMAASSGADMRRQVVWEHLNSLIQLGQDPAKIDPSFSERANYLSIGLEKTGEAPLIGHGLDSFRILSFSDTYSHNNYIEIAVSLGLTGLVLYYGFILKLLLSCLPRSREQEEARVFSVFLMLTLILDVGFVSYLFKPWILFFVLIAGHLSRQRVEDKIERRSFLSGGSPENRP